ncbi:MAG: DUF1631 family protein [Xanthomonadaceae bacterium]|nr:DUF1631 family protein [Xanthomonadaceae bacterium]MDE2256640.1 DUF1631 family protein [Xanthomonadaceae bacterium]
MSSANVAKHPFVLSPAPASEAEPALITLAERSQLSPHVREVLQNLRDLCATAFEPSLSETLSEYEKQLVRLADKATINQQNLYFDSVHQLKRGRADIAPRFLRSIEDALARLGENRHEGKVRNVRSAANLALTEGTQLDESLVLSEIATKVELRVREPLYALGHRFGVLAGTPRIAVEVMPLGPRSLTAALRYGTARLDLLLEHRLVLYRCFERVVMNQIGTLYDALNACLVARNILPRLHTLPTSDDATSASAAPAPARGLPDSQERAHEAQKAPNNSAAAARFDAVPGSPDGRRDFFGTLRQLLGECRDAETYAASGNDLQGALAALQACQATATLADAKPQLRSAEQIKQEILALLHEHRSDGRMPRIGDEDADAIDLVGLLFEFLSRSVRSHGMAYWVLAKLQVPVLRAALREKSFFSDAHHPARRLLNDFVEVGRFWFDENEAAADPVLLEKLQRLTQQIAREYQGEARLFALAAEELSQHIERLQRKIEVAERRQVEAAIGREKLERSRLLASAAIGERIAKNKPGEFLCTLLERGWTHVLTMTLLRDGEDSSAYSRQLAVVDRLLAAAAAGECATGTSPQELRAQVASGLMLAGLHDDDILAITQKLFPQMIDRQQENPISQTELALRLKARLGGEKPIASASGSMPSTDTESALTAPEAAALDQLRKLQPGTWLEFTVNPQRDKVRRKLSWYSAHTGRCLLLNQSGAPAEDTTMPQLARDVVNQRASIVSPDQQSIIDSAWATICGTLRNFSGRQIDSPRPATSSTGREADEAPPQAGAPPPEEARTLLVVDDEVNIQRALFRVLQNERYRIMCASSADEAMQILARQQVQVIISDQRMPGVSGTEFLTRVKASHPNTVRILLSGYSDAITVTDAINRGAIYKFLTKPWDDDDLRLQVRDAFRARALH